MLDFKKKPILGMIHLSGMEPLFRALEEIEILFEEGVDGCIIENYHGTTDDVIEVLQTLSVKKRLPNFEIG